MIVIICAHLGADGKTGWLIEPSADALVEQVRTLAENRDAIDALRQNDLLKVMAEPQLTTISGRPEISTTTRITKNGTLF